MALSFEVETPDGNKGSLSSADVARQFAGQGYQNVAVNPDGLSFSYDLNGQTYDGKIQDAIAGLGHKVASVKPVDADESFVQPAWRAGLQALGNDDFQRKNYIESKVRGLGLEGDVVGSGDDWYVHNPKTGKWYAATNAKGFDMSDAANAVAAAPQVIGGVVGGALAGAAGGLAGGLPGIATGAIGAAGGDLAGRTFTKTLGSYLDPDIEAAYGGHMGALKPTGADLGDAALSGLAGGVFNVPALAKVMNMGALSSAGRALGGTAEAAGTVASKVGGALAESPLAKQVGTAFVPGLGQVQNAGLLMRLGEVAPWLNKLVGRGGAKAAASAESAIAKGGLTAEEQGLAESIKGLGERTAFKSKTLQVPKSLEDAAPFRMNRKLFGGADKVTNEAVEQAAEESALKSGQTRAFYENVGSRLDRKRDMFLGKARGRAAQSSNPERFMELANARAGKGVGGAFDTVGKVAEAGSRLGRGIEGAAEGVTGLGFRGIQRGGQLLEKGGSYLKGGSRFMQPWENRILTNRLADQADDQGLESVSGLMRRSRKTPAFSN